MSADANQTVRVVSLSRSSALLLTVRFTSCGEPPNFPSEEQHPNSSCHRNHGCDCESSMRLVVLEQKADIKTRGHVSQRIGECQYSKTKSFLESVLHGKLNRTARIRRAWLSK